MPKPYAEFLTKKDLDAKHTAVVRAVETFREKNEYAPTARDIAKMTSLAVSSVRVILERLVHSGILVRPNGAARGLRVARDGEREQTLADAWRKRIRELPADERTALLQAATSLQEKRVGEATLELIDAKSASAGGFHDSSSP